MTNNIIHFPPRGPAGTEAAQEELDLLMAEFDEQFNELLGNLFTLCEAYPEYELFDPVQLGVSYAGVLGSLGGDPDALIGFRNVRDLCNEFGVDLEMVEVTEDGDILAEVTWGGDDDEE